jgi:hypothetical protein
MKTAQGAERRIRMIKDQTLENEYEELLLYLYDLAASKY